MAQKQNSRPLFLSTTTTSSETQDRSVGSGKTAAKIFKNERKSLWDAILKERVPRLIRMLVSDWAQKIFLCPIGGHHQWHCFLEFLIRRSLPADSTVLHTCPTRAWRAFLEKSFSGKWVPQNRRYRII